MRTIDSVRLYRYQLPLTRSLELASQFYSHRDGILVCLQSGTDEGWGDIAPLPGFSQESLMEVQSQAIILAKSLPDIPAASTDFDIYNLFPSVQFGFELAQFNLKTAIRNQAVTEPSPVTCCRLLNEQSYKNTLPTITLQGYQAVKIKVGRRALDDDLAFVHSVCREHPDLEVRIDANRTWTLKVAKIFLERTRNLSIGYIEEPLKDSADLAAFVRSSHIPLALDETLRELGAEQYRQFAEVYVLKPTLSGGITGTVETIRQAQSDHIRCIISSSYESGVGMLGLVELAKKIPNEAHGLDTYNIFEHDVLNDPFPLNRPELLSGRRMIKKSDLNLSVLRAL